MNPTDKQTLKAELNGIQEVLGSVDSLIKDARNQASAPPAAVATICNALQMQKDQIQKALKMLEKAIDKI